VQVALLSCNNCGAPIYAPENVTFVICARCASHLAVYHTDSLQYTKVLASLDDLAAYVHVMDAQMRVLAVEDDLAKLERSWAYERKRYLLRFRNGLIIEPTMSHVIGAALTAVLLLAGVLVFTLGPAIKSTYGAWNGLACVGLLITGGCLPLLYLSLKLYLGYRAYHEAKAAYLANRSEIEQRLS
jgi:hypothetical protein